MTKAEKLSPFLIRILIFPIDADIFWLQKSTFYK